MWKDIEKAKYIKIEWDGWNYTAGFMKDDNELAVWLKDGSLEFDDLVFEIKKAFKVNVAAKTKLCLRKAV